MKNIMDSLYKMSTSLDAMLLMMHSLVSVAARIYVAKVFFMAGLTKVRDWETTLFLFEEEYQVPLLPFEVAACLGTFGEIIFPVLLLAGLFTGFSALGLFIVNLVAVISLSEIAPAALYLHVIWGVLLVQIAIYGGGKLSLDRLLVRYFGRG